MRLSGKNTRKGPRKKIAQPVATTSKTPDVAQMLSDSIEICREGGRNNTRTAYNELINFLGMKLEVNPDGCQLASNTIQQLHAIFDFKRFAAVVDDHLGHLFTTLGIGDKALGQNLTPTNVADMMVAMTCQDVKPGQTILDPCVGFGVFLISAVKMVPPGVQFYGIEIDRTLYRTAIVQLTIFTDHGKRNPFFLLNGNTLMNPLPDWTTANSWTPKST